MDTVVITLREQQNEIDLELPITVPLYMLGPILAEKLTEKEIVSSLKEHASVTVYVVNSKTVVRPNETLAQAGVVNGDVLELTAAQQNPLPNPGHAREKGTYLQCRETGRIFACRSRAMLIGRLPQHPIRLHMLPGSDAVSRTHANLLRRSDGYWIKDERSANGTIVDGYTLKPGENVRLRPGSVIQFGVDGPVLTFHQAQ
ncbi:MAG: FHA domain-containing protein [Chloroflexi bacterium]|nr:MAG: FHA domain-containing protein [Chloroflexota bacterium]